MRNLKMLEWVGFSSHFKKLKPTKYRFKNSRGKKGKAHKEIKFQNSSENILGVDEYS